MHMKYVFSHRITDADVDTQTYIHTCLQVYIQTHAYIYICVRMYVGNVCVHAERKMERSVEGEIVSVQRWIAR